MSAGIVLRKCAALAEFHACVKLQREVWGEADLEVEPVTGFVVAANTGGQVLGAFDGARLVGYVLALVGYANGAVYLHSHHAGVHQNYRDRGVGRLLKLFQREEALARGIRLIQWTFDPLELRNAHFNLNRLGAICRHFKPNLYGITSSPLHRGLATDRLLAEWHLDSARVIAASNGLKDSKPTSSTSGPASVFAEIELVGDLRPGQNDSERVKHVQDRIRDEFTGWFARGYVATGIRKTPMGAAYQLALWDHALKSNG
jgi:predicted GNAT superfamily acetyltransferase